MSENATGLTADDLAVLQAPFAVEDHKFVKGSWDKESKQNLYFAYIDEDAIMTRIEQVDPSTGWDIKQIVTRKDADTTTVTAVGCLTIKGVSRDGTGSSSVGLYSYKKDDGTVVISESNEAEKSATTDALKRAARLFGIGRYLLRLPKWVNNQDDLRKWMQTEYSEQTATPTPPKTAKKGPNSAFSKKQDAAPTQSDNGAEIESDGDAPEQLFDMANMAAFQKWADDKLDVSTKDIADAMVMTFGKPLADVAPTLTKSQMIGAIIAWACSYDVDVLEAGYAGWPDPVYEAAFGYILQHKVKNAAEIGF